VKFFTAHLVHYIGSEESVGHGKYIGLEGLLPITAEARRSFDDNDDDDRAMAPPPNPQQQGGSIAKRGRHEAGAPNPMEVEEHPTQAVMKVIPAAGAAAAAAVAGPSGTGQGNGGFDFLYKLRCLSRGVHINEVY